MSILMGMNGSYDGSGKDFDNPNVRYIISREYVLDRLDMWMIDRYQRFYTPEFAESLIAEAKAYIDMYAPSQAIKDRCLQNIDSLRRDRMINNISRVFTKIHATTEDICTNHRPSLEQRLLAIRKGPNGEANYQTMQRALTEFDKVGQFVNYCRKIADQDMSSDITFADIEEGFVQIIGGYQGMIRILGLSSDAQANVVVQHQIKEGRLNESEAGFLKQMHNLIREMGIKVQEKVFGDLEERTESRIESRADSTSDERGA